MNRNLFRSGLSGALATLAATFALSTIALAQVSPDGIADGAPAAESASHMIHDALDAKRAARDAERSVESARPQARQVPAPAAAGVDLLATSPAPGATPDTGGFGGFEVPPKPGFQHPNSPGFGYRVDLSSSFAYGDIGIRTNHLKGGFDGEAYIAPDRYTRILAGHYSVDFYPVGFDTGTVPAYLSSGVVGVPLPGGRINCAVVAAGLPTCPANLNTGQNDASVQDRVEILSLQKMIYVGGLLPIVISPTYVSEKGSIGGYDDRFLAWDLKNATYHQVHLRTEQKKSIFLTVPFAASRKLFGTLTAGPTWNLNTTGVNSSGNSAQIFEEMDLRYFANASTTFYFQPSRLPTYEPDDPYSVNIATFIEGVSRRVGGPKSPLFVTAYLLTATPTNPPNGHSGRLGVVDVTCVGGPANAIPCSSYAGQNPRTNTAVLFGGTKSTSINLSFGIGSPSMFPL